MNNKGSTSVVILGVLLLLSVLFLSASLFITVSLRNLRRAEEREREKRILINEANRIVELLLEDPTPFADSPRDPVWEKIQSPMNEGITVNLEDASSFLGINWVRKELLTTMAVLKVEKTAAELQQFRENTGIHSDLSSFLNFFEEDYIKGFFTVYNYFNINICDEFVLRKLYLIRSFNWEEAERFHTRVQEIRIKKKQIENEDLKEFLDESDYNLLFPVVNAEPVMNIHFVPERILNGLCEYYEVPKEKAERIIVLREASELTIKDVKELMGKEYEESLLHHYLGIRTWFWKINIVGEHLELTRIIARIPQEGEETRAELRLIEEAFRP